MHGQGTDIIVIKYDIVTVCIYICPLVHIKCIPHQLSERAVWVTYRIGVLIYLRLKLK